MKRIFKEMFENIPKLMNSINSQRDSTKSKKE